MRYSSDQIATVRRDALAGDDESAHWLGHHYLADHTPEGYQEATVWLDMAARRGHAPSALTLAGVVALQTGSEGLEGRSPDIRDAISQIAFLIALALRLGIDPDVIPDDIANFVSPAARISAERAASTWLNLNTN
jgi:hypothetical protein